MATRSADLPLAAIIYTDIERDGMLTGPNLDALSRLAQAACHPIIASGGIATLDDVRGLAKLEPTIIVGALVGKALYESRFSLKEAIAAAR